MVQESAGFKSSLAILVIQWFGELVLQAGESSGFLNFCAGWGSALWSVVDFSFNKERCLLKEFFSECTPFLN